VNTLYEARHTGAQFLILDLHVAFTFIQISQTSDVQETRARTLRKAALVYRQVSDFVRSGRVSQNDAETIKLLLQELRRSLESLGETV
jgi:hypothetical protein